MRTIDDEPAGDDVDQSRDLAPCVVGSCATCPLKIVCVTFSALVLALAISAKAGWEYLPTSDYIIGRGESRPIKIRGTLAGEGGSGGAGVVQMTVPQQGPVEPFIPLKILPWPGY